MQITFTGSNTRFFFQGFLNFDNTQATATYALNSPTELVATNAVTGMTTTITGTGMTLDANGNPNGGTYTSMVFEQNGIQQGTITGLNWGVLGVNFAANELVGIGDYSYFASLFNATGPIGIDATAATAGFDMYSFLSGMVGQITQPVNAVGSDFYDILIGSPDADTFDLGSNFFSSDEVEGTLGNDTIDFANASAQSFAWLDYEDFVNGAVTFAVDGNANTGTISGTGFTDTLLNVRQIMEGDGLALEGSEDADLYNVTSHLGGWIMMRGNEGNDTYNITMHGNGRISFYYGSSSLPTSGIDVNLVSGVVANDGFGSTDQINFLGGGGTLEIDGTHLNDSIIGSDRNESFRVREGSDTIDGGGGDDRVRYNRGDIESVSVDLSTGVATKIVSGVTLTDTLSNIEIVTGTTTGNDSLVASSGNDTLYGIGGDDTLIGNDGKDHLNGYDGNDLIDASGGATATQGTGDFVSAGIGQDTIIGHAGLYAAGNGIDIGYNTIGGFDGLTITRGDGGAGTAVGGSGLVNDTFTFADAITGTNNADTLISNNTAADMHRAIWIGAGGNDTITGSDFGPQVIDYDYGGFGIGITAVFTSDGAGTVLDNYGDTDTFSKVNIVVGTDFNDVMTGHNGDQVFFGGAGADTLDGGADSDTVSYRTSSELVVVNLNNGAAIGGDAQGDTLLNIEGLEGSAYADRLTGDAGANLFDGGGGNDLISGLNGTDVIEGGEGQDSLAGGSGDDTLMGGTGDDRLFGNNDNDSIDGGAGDDFTNGGAGNDTINGGEDDDNVLVGGSGEDSISGDGGNDGMNGSFGDDTLMGGTGEDRLYGADGEDSLLGGAENDTLSGQADQDVLFGGTGDDGMNGGGDGDILYGEGGFDRLYGGTGNDTLNGGADNDLLVGQSGIDTFVFDVNWGQDQISGYGNVASGQLRVDEVIDMSSLGITFADLTLQSNGNFGTLVFITADGSANNSINILFRGASEVTSSDFFFG